LVFPAPSGKIISPRSRAAAAGPWAKWGGFAHEGGEGRRRGRRATKGDEGRAKGGEGGEGADEGNNPGGGEMHIFFLYLQPL